MGWICTSFLVQDLPVAFKFSSETSSRRAHYSNVVLDVSDCKQNFLIQEWLQMAHLLWSCLALPWDMANSCLLPSSSPWRVALLASLGVSPRIVVHNMASYTSLSINKTSCSCAKGLLDLGEQYTSFPPIAILILTASCIQSVLRIASAIQ